MSDEQIRSVGQIIEKYYNPSDNVYRGPPQSQYGQMPESKYDRGERLKASGCISILQLQPGNQYVLIEGDNIGAIVTYVGPTTPKNLLTPRQRHLFLNVNSTELIFDGFDFENFLPMIPLHKFPSLEGDGT